MGNVMDRFHIVSFDGFAAERKSEKETNIPFDQLKLFVYIKLFEF
jgi:hypothetical protein